MVKLENVTVKVLLSRISTASPKYLLIFPLKYITVILFNLFNLLLKIKMKGYRGTIKMVKGFRANFEKQ